MIKESTSRPCNRWIVIINARKGFMSPEVLPKPYYRLTIISKPTKHFVSKGIFQMWKTE